MRCVAVEGGTTPGSSLVLGNQAGAFCERCRRCQERRSIIEKNKSSYKLDRSLPDVLSEVLGPET